MCWWKQLEENDSISLTEYQITTFSLWTISHHFYTNQIAPSTQKAWCHFRHILIDINFHDATVLGFWYMPSLLDLEVNFGVLCRCVSVRCFLAFSLLHYKRTLLYNKTVKNHMQGVVDFSWWIFEFLILLCF